MNAHIFSFFPSYFLVGFFFDRRAALPPPPLINLPAYSEEKRKRKKDGGFFGGKRGKDVGNGKFVRVVSFCSPSSLLRFSWF